MNGNAPAEDQGEDQILRDSGVRLADLETIHKRLLAERHRRLDVVVGRRMISFEDGWLMIHAGESTNIVTDEGITSAAGLYRPAVTGIETLGKMLGIDIGFMKKLYAENPPRTDIISAIVNGRLHGSILGMDSDVRNGFSNIKVTYDIEADASPDDIKALVAQSQKRSAVFDLLTNPTDITVEVT